MERREAKSIGDVLRDLFSESCMEDALLERKAVALWPHVVGEAVAAQCRKPDIKAGKMIVGIANAALRNELHMTRSGLIRALNDLLKKDIVKEIRFTS